MSPHFPIEFRLATATRAVASHGTTLPAGSAIPGSGVTRSRLTTLGSGSDRCPRVNSHFPCHTVDRLSRGNCSPRATRKRAAVALCAPSIKARRAVSAELSRVFLMVMVQLGRQEPYPSRPWLGHSFGPNDWIPLAPGSEPPGEGGCIKPDAPEVSSRTGARRFIWSGTVGDDRAPAWLSLCPVADLPWQELHTAGDPLVASS